MDLVNVCNVTPKKLQQNNDKKEITRNMLKKLMVRSVLIQTQNLLVINIEANGSSVRRPLYTAARSLRNFQEHGSCILEDTSRSWTLLRRYKERLQNRTPQKLAASPRSSGSGFKRNNIFVQKW